MYTVIKDSGKQFKVSEGDSIQVDIRGMEKGKELEFKEVLLFADGQDVRIGRPLLSDIKVLGIVEGEGKAKKLRIQKFKSKKNYQRRTGHRQKFMTVKITKIALS